MENMYENGDLTLMDIMKIIKKRILFIIIITMLCTGVMSYRSIFISKPMYETFTTAVIVKGDTENIKNTGYTQSDITMYQKVTETYVQIAQSDLVIGKTAEELKIYSPEQLRTMVTAIARGETQIIELRVRTTDREVAANVANVYCKNFIEQSMTILPIGKIEVLDPAKTPTYSTGTDNTNKITVGFLFGLFTSVVIVFIRYYIDSSRIRNEKQITNIFKMPLLITIEQ